MMYFYGHHRSKHRRSQAECISLHKLQSRENSPDVISISSPNIVAECIDGNTSSACSNSHEIESTIGIQTTPPINNALQNVTSPVAPPSTTEQPLPQSDDGSEHLSVSSSHSVHTFTAVDKTAQEQNESDNEPLSHNREKSYSISHAAPNGTNSIPESGSSARLHPSSAAVPTSPKGRAGSECGSEALQMKLLSSPDAVQIFPLHSDLSCVAIILTTVAHLVNEWDEADGDYIILQSVHSIVKRVIPQLQIQDHHREHIVRIKHTIEKLRKAVLKRFPHHQNKRSSEGTSTKYSTTTSQRTSTNNMVYIRVTDCLNEMLGLANGWLDMQDD